MAEQQIVVFSLAGEKYGVPVAQVESIERVMEITRVPRTLPFIKGVVNLRGQVVPVIDLRERFQFEAAEYTEDTRMVVVRVDDMVVGVVVDSVHDVRTIDSDAVEEPPSMVGGMHAAYLNGVYRSGEDLLVLVNLPKVLSEAEAKQLQEAELAVHGE
ncbi:chemotaxis protein CheW [Alicyclobacillus contaminans]|uniref:chemotaxis protein CheW n=1 Tax=Alicyclobacillus contaminans TaxID=392016 RepID=UPI000404D357|nr:chemotaxis protein CheW [Alicyclobacillus contaminans]GMA49017.1 chemotaxis protein CheW [Alicyclobacillus contaminans]